MNIIPVNDLESPELDIFARLSETQLLHYHEPEPGLFIAESPNVIMRAVEAGYQPVSLLVEQGALDKEARPVLQCISDHMGEETAEVLPVYLSDREVLKELTGYALVRGLWGAFRRRPVQPLGTFCEDKDRLVVLYDIVNPTNVGAITRSAAALGMDGMIVTRDTVNPLYRRSARVSMGTVFNIPWTVAGDCEPGSSDIVHKLKGLGYVTVAMALKDRSLGVDDPVLKEQRRLAVILGTEGYGLPDNVIDACDYTVKIPMYHGVDSLNVAAASAVCFWELMK
ncbi:MAG: RNA methyltransferase [Lachnospiraceae bacterium]|nr:RNA methyltransferase [Lachnospiraceae bacterium]